MRLFNLQKKTTLLNTLRKYASVFHRNIESLQWHILKTLMAVFPLSQQLSYNRRRQLDFSSKPLKSVYYGIESLGYLQHKF